jgi:copper chaperone CopZ
MKIEDKSNIAEETIEIKGMHCKSCVCKIENAVAQIDGVEKVGVSLLEEKAYLRFDPRKTSLNNIRSVVGSLGYHTGSDKAGKNSSAGKGSVKEGILLGLLPHTGCIAFTLFSIFGVTAATQLFRPLLLNPYFFYILIGISFVFATISALIYLKNQGLINLSKADGKLKFDVANGLLQRKWKYLSTLYGTTVAINLLLFMVVFPLVANVSSASAAPTGPGAASAAALSSLKLQVNIPCSGHASLISGDIKAISGVSSVTFSFPNIFEVKYDPTKTTEQQILELGIFKTYAATVVS